MKAIFATILCVGLLTLNPVSRVFAQNQEPPKGLEVSAAKVLAAGGVKRIAGQLVVKYRHGVTANDIDSLNSMLGSQVVKIQPRSRLHRLAIPQDAILPRILTELSNSPIVEEVAYNYVVPRFTVPNDT